MTELRFRVQTKDSGIFQNIWTMSAASWNCALVRSHSGVVPNSVDGRLQHQHIISAGVHFGKRDAADTIYVRMVLLVKRQEM
jgi:hypothetical protein